MVISLSDGEAMFAGLQEFSKHLANVATLPVVSPLHSHLFLLQLLFLLGIITYAYPCWVLRAQDSCYPWVEGVC